MSVAKHAVPTGLKNLNAIVFCYKHAAPTELKAQAFVTFQKVFDLLTFHYLEIVTDVALRRTEGAGCLAIAIPFETIAVCKIFSSVAALYHCAVTFGGTSHTFQTQRHAEHGADVARNTIFRSRFAPPLAALYHVVGGA